MKNLITPAVYQQAPTAESSMQKGGHGYNHKRGCKCRLCKKKGGADPENGIDYDASLDLTEQGFGDRRSFDEEVDYLESDKDKNNDKNKDKNESSDDYKIDILEEDDATFADDDDYEKLNEKGNDTKVGGSRRRKYTKKSKKSINGRKTRRYTRKVKKHGRRTRRHRK